MLLNARPTLLATSQCGDDNRIFTTALNGKGKIYKYFRVILIFTHRDPARGFPLALVRTTELITFQICTTLLGYGSSS